MPIRGWHRGETKPLLEALAPFRDSIEDVLEYAQDALDSAELARLRWLMLQVRDWGNGRSVALAQRTRRETLQRHLTRYALTWQSSRMRNGYVFYVFEKRRER